MTALQKRLERYDALNKHAKTLHLTDESLKTAMTVWEIPEEAMRFICNTAFFNGYMRAESDQYELEQEKTNQGGLEWHRNDLGEER